ncbi:MAG: hypothetical protein CVT95_12650 [Bacteroidetes bacterium HGW-Bacteroidetes-12]|nr:MAG: hypothetical protein CVT95_12650 [Bacteroidetes bacterium HGW-Bacteroidetes-12]
MINKQNRKSLIDYRIEQAKNTIELANFLIESNRLIVAVNRIYYGLYYAVTALAIKTNSRHQNILN